MSEVDLSALSEKLRPIFRRYRIQTAIVFGSLARGDATRKSDLDLILIQQTEKRFLERYEGILYELGNVVSGRDIDLLIYTPQELESISDRPFIRSVLREGKTIYEYREETA